MGGRFRISRILPLAYGDRDGYSTDNWVTYDYASYMAPDDISKVNAGKMKYADPKLVKPLAELVKFKQQGCVNPDASTHENNDANTYFNLGEAMELRYFKSRRYVDQLRRWVSNEADRTEAIDNYRRHIELKGVYADSARAGLQRLEWVSRPK